MMNKKRETKHPAGIGANSKLLLPTVLLLLVIGSALFQLTFGQGGTPSTSPPPASTTTAAQPFSVDYSYIDNVYFYQGLLTECNMNTGIANMSWIETALLALLISAGIAALGYMLSKYFQLGRLSQWSMDAIYHLIISAVMVVLLVAYLGFGSSSNPNSKLNPSLIPHLTDVAGEHADTSMQAGMLYIQKVQHNLFAYYFMLSTMNMALSVLSQGVTIRPMMFGLTFNLGPMLAPLLHTTTMLLNGLQLGLAATIIYGMSLCFIGNYFLSVFLPVGIMLRTFYFTRDVGAFVIAIALSFYIVYPLLLNLNYLIVNAHYGEAFTDPLSLFKFSGFMTAISSFVVGFFGAAGSLWALAYKLLIIGVLKMSFAVMYVIFVGPFLYRMFEEAMYYVIIVCGVLPIINIFITLSCARELSKLMGAEISLAPLSRFI